MAVQGWFRANLTGMSLPKWNSWPFLQAPMSVFLFALTGTLFVAKHCYRFAGKICSSSHLYGSDLFAVCNCYFCVTIAYTIAACGSPAFPKRINFWKMFSGRGVVGSFAYQQARKPRNYASLKLSPTHLLTGVRCRATSVSVLDKESHDLKVLA